MGAMMAIVMMSFMLAMHPNRTANVAIYLVSGVILVAAVWVLRSQATVDDVDYMKALIPQRLIADLSN